MLTTPAALRISGQSSGHGDNMGLSVPLLILPFVLSASAIADPSTQTDPSSPATTTVSFRPSVAIVVGIFIIMFTLTFLLLMYARFCHPGAAQHRGPPGIHQFAPARGGAAGLDKTVIESLPFFRFSALKGSRGGLECAVCLSRFEDTELLRLLPKCKHAFHLACVDLWLEGHSSCPLCRHKVVADDVETFKNSESGNNFELFIEREPSNRYGSSRFSLGGSFRKIDEGGDENRDALLAPEDDDRGEFLHKFKHRIIFSDVVFNRRWSDVNSSDLMSLNSEMLNVISSKRFTAFDPRNGEIAPSASRPSVEERVVRIKEEMGKKRLLDSKATQMSRSSIVNVDVASGSEPSRSLVTPGNRSVSEITGLSRFRVARDASVNAVSRVEDDRVRRVWLPIARRTVQWFAGRERRSHTRYRRDVTIV